MGCLGGFFGELDPFFDNDVQVVVGSGCNGYFAVFNGNSGGKPLQFG
jgi:hypothetical protein